MAIAASLIIFVGLVMAVIAVTSAAREQHRLAPRQREVLSLTLGGERRIDHVCGNAYTVLFTRHASHVIWNQLGNDRRPVLAALELFLQSVEPDRFAPRRPILFSHRHPNRIVQYVFAADELPESSNGDVESRSPHDRYVVVFAVQPSLESVAGRSGERANCHLTTEMFQAERTSLVSTSIEFALGAIPAKRINFICSEKGEWRRISEDGSEREFGFDHFVSAAYSNQGLALLDFVITAPHKPNDVLPRERWTREDYIEWLTQILVEPTTRICREMEEDETAHLAPPNITHLSQFFEVIRQQVAQSVLTNLSIFDVETKSNINPPLRQHRWLNDIDLPR